MTDVCIIIAIAVYLIGMIFIGIRFSNQNKNSEDFYLDVKWDLSLSQ